MKMKNKAVFATLLVGLIFASLFVGCIGKEEKISQLQIKSPNGNINLNLFIKDSSKTLNYNVFYKDKKIITDSLLGLEINEIPIDHDFEIIKVIRESKDEIYALVNGKAKEVRNNYNQVIVSVKSQNIIIDLTFRIYDDGVALRYTIPKQNSLAGIEIFSESTQFHFPANYRAWALRLDIRKTPHGFLKYSSGYEGYYSQTTLKDIDQDSLIGMPLLIETEVGWVGITEANLRNYAGMFLSGTKEFPTLLVSKLAPLSAGENLKVKTSTPCPSPWRVIMIGSEIGDLIESNLVLNLNEPRAIKDPSWIKPGKAAWPWWSGRVVKGEKFKGGMNTATMKHYTDFAARHNIEYLLIDAGWYCPESEAWEKPLQQDITRVTAKNLDLKEVIRYAEQHGVKVILWVHGASLKKQMAKALPLYQERGVAGIKVDSYGREDQEWVNFCWEVAKKAADHKLVVDFHGAYKPTGMRRTYPNVLTREGVLGLEWSKWSNKCTLEHEVTIPFTRMVAGPMDFTPGAFAPEHFKFPWKVKGTRTRQLAMYVVYESPLQMLVDYPAAYEEERGFEFLKEVPTTWDKTLVIGGEVGEYVVIARMHGGEWWIGAMTDENQRELSFSLDFLEEGAWEAYIWEDGSKAAKDPISIQFRKEPVTPQSQIRAQLAPGGGLAIRIIPV
jgi:alpha-glucosidase